MITTGFCTIPAGETQCLGMWSSSMKAGQNIVVYNQPNQSPSLSNTHKFEGPLHEDHLIELLSIFLQETCSLTAFVITRAPLTNPRPGQSACNRLESLLSSNWSPNDVHPTFKVTVANHVPLNPAIHACRPQKLTRVLSHQLTGHHLLAARPPAPGGGHHSVSAGRVCQQGRSACQVRHL